MRHRPTVLLSLILSATLSFSAFAEDAEDAPPPRASLKQEAVPGVMEKAVDDFIRPGYRDLMEGAESLAEAAHMLCEKPSEETLGDVQMTFDEVVQQWSTIEIVRVGPVTEGNRFERFLFFPDRKSTGLKQVQRILAASDETATSAETLKGKSVATQGLGALEYVLYGTGAEVLATEKNGFRCRYGTAIADNLKSIATELSAEWEKPDGIQAAWKKPGPDNPLYRDGKEAATELLGILVHGVESIRDQRLRPFYAGIIKGEPDKGHPKLAIYWRSGNTMPALSANFLALQTLFNTADMQALLPKEDQSVVGAVNYVLQAIVDDADQIDLPIDEAIADDEQRALLNRILQNTNDVLQRLNLDFGAAIGLTSGFSFADGD
ncbi:MAG TPA: imelysin family protein [Pararhizobium sp.]|uniref:imelysin family protein n=1 Tax=Pararhizobium sp. TaxID=1977563 RepID=UPI002B75299C|nr:imelysin family protein [Pararhizobium sp.]HTO31131.1 imelysin family protein [Pararhizobium sp.]